MVHTGWIIRSTSNSMVTGSKEVCRGSQENLVMYRSFFFLSFFFFESFRLRLFPFFFWLDRLVFFFFCFVVFRFFGWAGGRWFKEHGRDICNISVEFSKRDSLCVRVFGRRINSSYSGGLCPAAVSRQISLFRTIWAVAFNVNNIEGEWWFNGRQRVCNYCYEFVGTKGVFERDSEII